MGGGAGLSTSTSTPRLRNTGYPVPLVPPYSPPVPCAASAVALANLVPGPCPHGVFLKPEDLTASVSLQAEPGGSGVDRERGQEEREMGHVERQQGKRR